MQLDDPPHGLAEPLDRRRPYSHSPQMSIETFMSALMRQARARS